MRDQIDHGHVVARCNRPSSDYNSKTTNEYLDAIGIEIGTVSRVTRRGLAEPPARLPVRSAKCVNEIQKYLA